MDILFTTKANQNSGGKYLLQLQQMFLKQLDIYMKKIKHSNLTIHKYQFQVDQRYACKRQINKASRR